MEPLKPGIVAAIVTHRRPHELQRLLDGLAASTLPLLGCVISDHAPTGKTKSLAAAAPFETIVLENPANPGPGAGWANAAHRAFEHFGDKVSAIWFLDDDVTVAPDALEILWREKGDAAAIAPLLSDERGGVWAFPEPVSVPLRKTVRQAATPADALRLLGRQPIPFCWCTGACMLVTRQAIETIGWHREDFLFLGEDLEYSMRIAGQLPAVFTCLVTVPHLPPPYPDPATAKRADYVKFCSLLQNLSYLSFHSRYSRHMKFYLPGNYRRFFRTHGWSVRTLRDALACLWNGIVLSRPRGARPA